MKIFKKKSIYLDYAGATPIDEKVLKEILQYEKEYFANPSAIYNDGVKARAIIENARLKIAKLINAHSDEIIFTGSGTESDALAILGILNKFKLENVNKIPHMITTEIEHPAVLENCRRLEEEKRIEVTYLKVDKNGLVNLDELKEALKENTALVSVMYANNEIGTIQPIEEIAKIIRSFKKGKSAPQGKALDSLKALPLSADFPLFHTDATQAMNYLFTENIEKLGVDMLTFNGSKIYGPKGVGVLYKKRGIELEPLYYGGGQEFGLRSGTENVALIAGIALALEQTCMIKEKESKRLIEVRDYAIKKLLGLSDMLPFKIILNGDIVNRLPNNINISISGVSSELLVIELDAKGIMVSAKSACKSDEQDASHVIKAIRKICKRNDGIPEGSLRISLGRQTNIKEMDILVEVLKEILSKYKEWK